MIVAKDARQASAPDIQALASQYLASYKTPKRIIFQQALPRNAAGKLLRRVLRDEHS